MLGYQWDRNGTSLSNVRTVERLDLGTIARYERELARQEIQLREARARAEVLLHQRDELIERRETPRALFAARGNAASRIASLTPRQRQVMELVLDGHPSKNIAADLNISQRTVENHRAAIMKKTGTRCLPALARLALAATWNNAAGPTGGDAIPWRNRQTTEGKILVPASAAGELPEHQIDSDSNRDRAVSPWFLKPGGRS